MWFFKTESTSIVMRWQLSLYYLLYQERPNFYVYGSFWALTNSRLYIVSIRLASISTFIYRLATVTNHKGMNTCCCSWRMWQTVGRTSNNDFFVLNYWLTTAQFITYCVQTTWLFTFRDLRMWQLYARTNGRTDEYITSLRIVLYNDNYIIVNKHCSLTCYKRRNFPALDG